MLRKTSAVTTSVNTVEPTNAMARPTPWLVIAGAFRNMPTPAGTKSRDRFASRTATVRPSDVVDSSGASGRRRAYKSQQTNQQSEPDYRARHRNAETARDNFSNELTG